ncbi:MAG: porin, partial [Pseudomonadota bacterium]
MQRCRQGVAAAALLGLAEPGIAQSSWFEGWEGEGRAEATVALSPGRGDAGDRDSRDGTAEIALTYGLERVLENGAEIGVRLGGRFQLDHPARPGFSGLIGPGGEVDDGLALRGAFTGLTAAGLAEDDAVVAQLETVFAYIDGGYGELLAGRDIGVARRFHEGPETVFRRHTAVNARLDTSGIATVLTRSDLTGPSFKVSYATPRLLGVRLGASYTPSADTGGVDRDPALNEPGIAEPRLDQAVEVGVNATRLLRASGVRVSAYGAYSRANVDLLPNDLDFGTVEVWSAGTLIEREGVRFGADFLSSDNGGGRYQAWSVGLASEWQGFDWSGGF